MGWDSWRLPLQLLPAGADVRKVICEHRRRQPLQWLMLALGLFLVMTAGTVLWVSMRNAASTSSIGLEAQKELLISDMVSAVQVEAERAGAFAGQIPGMGAMEGGDSMESMAGRTETSGMSTDGAPGDMAEGDMSEMGTSGQVVGGLLADDPGLLVAISSFGEAAGSLTQLTSDSEQQAFEGVIAAHNDFVASLVALDGRVQSGQDAMSFYHGNTQVLEAGLRASLQDLQLSSSVLLQSAVEEVASTEPLLRWAVPAPSWHSGDRLSGSNAGHQAAGSHPRTSHRCQGRVHRHGQSRTADPHYCHCGFR